MGGGGGSRERGNELWGVRRGPFRFVEGGLLLLLLLFLIELFNGSLFFGQFHPPPNIPFALCRSILSLLSLLATIFVDCLDGKVAIVAAVVVIVVVGRENAPRNDNRRVIPPINPTHSTTNTATNKTQRRRRNGRRRSRTRNHKRSIQPWKRGS